jgi:hypothetical protein
VFGDLWQAAKVRWPWVFEQVDAAMEDWIVEQMYTVSLLCSHTIFLQSMPRWL